MKVIIAGSRSLASPRFVFSAIHRGLMTLGIKKPTEIVSGGAGGVDYLGELWAAQMGIPIRAFPAAWDRYGRSAGPMRNAEMAAYADALVLIWDGQSRGSANMRAQMLRLSKPIAEEILYP